MRVVGSRSPEGVFIAVSVLDERSRLIVSYPYISAGSRAPLALGVQVYVTDFTANMHAVYGRHWTEFSGCAGGRMVVVEVAALRIRWTTVHLRHGWGPYRLSISPVCQAR